MILILIPTYKSWCELFRFFCRKQLPGERFPNFLRSLREMAEKSLFPEESTSRYEGKFQARKISFQRNNFFCFKVTVLEGRSN